MKANNDDLRRSLNNIMEQIIARVKAGTKPTGQGIFGTWEAAFRMAMRNEIPDETVQAKFEALKPHLKDTL